jgi:RND family efflux transporter MFP subunit
MMTQNDSGIFAEPPGIPWWNKLLRLAAVCMILGAGVALGVYLYHSKPRTQKAPPRKWIPLVQVEPLSPIRHRIVVRAMGTVVPARQVLLKARVPGEVVEIHPEFTEGGFLQKGEMVLRLDDVDYQLALAQKQSERVTSRYNMELEMGRQTVAHREWDLLKKGLGAEGTDDSLVLRKPHLEKAAADVEAAESAVKKLELDLQRTRIFAPFNGMVRSRTVDIGSQVSTQEAIAELVGTDRYWVQTSVLVDRLDWIRIPRQDGEEGSPAKIRYAGGQVMSGRVARLLGELDGESRMARILVEVEDPLHRRPGDGDAVPLLIGEFVQVEIEGRTLDDVFLIPRTALRDNHLLWLAGPEEKLLIREVDPIWKGETTVVVRDHLQEGERLIVSDLSAPIEGMDVRVQETQPPENPGKNGARQHPAKKGS